MLVSLHPSTTIETKTLPMISSRFSWRRSKWFLISFNLMCRRMARLSLTTTPTMTLMISVVVPNLPAPRTALLRQNPTPLRPMTLGVRLRLRLRFQPQQQHPPTPNWALPPILPKTRGVLDRLPIPPLWRIGNLTFQALQNRCGSDQIRGLNARDDLNVGARLLAQNQEPLSRDVFSSFDSLLLWPLVIVHDGFIFSRGSLSKTLCCVRTGFVLDVVFRSGEG